MLKEGPHLRIPHRVMKNKLYPQWLGTTECKIWNYLVPNIIRAPMRNNMLKMLYTEFYNKAGRLVSCSKQEDIAEFLGLKSHSQVSKCLKKMSDMGVIVTHNVAWGGKPLKVYELGYLSPEPDRFEILHLFKYLEKKQAALGLENFKNEDGDHYEVILDDISNS